MIKSLPRTERHGTAFRKQTVKEYVSGMDRRCQEILHNPKNPCGLTPSEVQCLVGMLDGQTIREMSRNFNKATKTIGSFTEGIHAKMKAHNSMDLSRACLFHGYISYEDFIKPYKDKYTAKINGDGYRIWRKK